MLKKYSRIIRPLHSLGYQIILKMPKRYPPKLRRPTIFEDYFNTELSVWKNKNNPVCWSTKLSDKQNRHLKLNSFKNIKIN